MTRSGVSDFPKAVCLNRHWDWDTSSASCPKLDAADASLARGYNVYPSGSEEQKAVVAKQEQLRLLRSSKQMGASPKIDIAGLRAIAKQELARLRAETVGH
jgi:hypothetical protein